MSLKISQLVQISRIARLVKGKRVALVGNAETLLNGEHGRKIDEHDVVVRFNLGIIQNPVSQGARTDVLGFSIKISKEDLARHFGTPCLVWLTPKNREEYRDYFKTFEQGIDFYPTERWKTLSGALKNSRPSSGLMMLDLVCRLKPTIVNLFGFDFKKSKTFYLQNDHKGPHNWTLEHDMCNRFLARKGGEIYK